ncbi:hypothetical protein BLNAU_20891 [Blattamonas nauphoetae]|uniref:Uncharacterized protein n=1 Tax=Blattamonas nauphoetae TaxID=2049346 RepID=A0ABQ9WXH6_9EUKA|nr:hypothetical protein BLNAU_20891 [Blattamonas nauphoetae]
MRIRTENFTQTSPQLRILGGTMLSVLSSLIEKHMFLDLKDECIAAALPFCSSPTDFGALEAASTFEIELAKPNLALDKEGTTMGNWTQLTCWSAIKIGNTVKTEQPAKHPVERSVPQNKNYIYFLNSEVARMEKDTKPRRHCHDLRERRAINTFCSHTTASSTPIQRSSPDAVPQIPGLVAYDL